MKIGVVADIHCGPDRDTQLGSNAPVLLEAFCEAMDAFKPDLIVDLGDRINAVAHGQDRQRTAWARRRLTEVGVPVYHALGNTDVAHLTKSELATVLQKRGPYECAEEWGPRIVILDSVDPPVERIGGEIGLEQRRWLAGVLDEGRPALIFAHHPLDDQDLGGHRYFAERRDLACVGTRAEIRALCERGGRAQAVFAGHMHWTRSALINGIPYVTLGSLVDAAYSDGRSAGTYAEVTVSDRTIDVRVAGARGHHLRFPAT